MIHLHFSKQILNIYYSVISCSHSVLAVLYSLAFVISLNFFCNLCFVAFYCFSLYSPCLFQLATSSGCCGFSFPFSLSLCIHVTNKCSLYPIFPVPGDSQTDAVLTPFFLAFFSSLLSSFFFPGLFWSTSYVNPRHCRVGVRLFKKGS